MVRLRLRTHVGATRTSARVFAPKPGTILHTCPPGISVDLNERDSCTSLIFHTTCFSHTLHVRRVDLTRSQIAIREHAEELFANDEVMQKIILSTMRIKQDELEKDPSFVEAVLRNEFLEKLDDMQTNMIVARRMIVHDDLEALNLAFGNAMTPPRDLVWLDKVKQHVRASFGMPTPGPPAMGLWSYDLDTATTRLYETMCDIGLNVRESIQPGQEIQLSYSNEDTANFVIVQKFVNHGACTRIYAATDLHESMLKTYKAILAMFHSFERKYFTVSSKEEAREVKMVREAAGFRNLLITVIDDDMCYKVVD